MEIITTSNAPKAIGPYSQGINHHHLVFTSGQIPLNPQTNELVQDDFKEEVKQVLQNIDDIYALEAGLYSDKYKVAGRVDCIAEYNGVLSAIDFKTSTKERKDEWNENYYIQCSAYAEMYGERTGTEIEQIVILCVTEDGTVQEFVKEKFDYLDALTETVTEWRNQNEASSSNTGNVSVDGMSDN